MHNQLMRFRMAAGGQLLAGALSLFVLGCGGNSPGPPGGTGGPPPLSGVSISPSSAAVLSGATQQFTATASGGSTSTIDWSVNGIDGGSSAVGTISASGVYTAPTPQKTLEVTVAATSADNPSVSASVSVTVVSAVRVGIAALQQRWLAASTNGIGYPDCGHVNGATNTSLTYSLNGIVGGNPQLGTILPSSSPGGCAYAFPSGKLTAPVNVILAATSVADPAVSAFGELQYFPSPGQALTVGGGTPFVDDTLNDCLSVSPGNQLSLVATDTIPNDTVVWSVNGVAGGNATVGTIAANSRYGATYTAPVTIPSADSVTVTATSSSQSAISASRMVTVANPATAVSIVPSSASIPLGSTLQFHATVTGGTSSTISWAFTPLTSPPPPPTILRVYSLSPSLPGGESIWGTISDTGLYTAPQSTTVGVLYVVALSNAGCVASPPGLVAFSNFVGP